MGLQEVTMKITHNKVGQNLNVRDSGKASKAEGAGNAKESKFESAGAAGAQDLGSIGASKVDLSARAQDIKRARDVAMAAPDVDEAKVSRLQKLIDDGNYKT